MTWEEFERELSQIGVYSGKGGEPFVALPSKQSMRWLMPICDRPNWTTALLLYTPNTLQGNLYLLLLSILPLCVIKEWQRRNLILLNWSQSFCVDENKTPSFYVGNEGADSKATVQIQDKGTLCSYLKFTSSERIAKLFNQEQQALKEVACVHSAEVPRVLRLEQSGRVCLFEASSVKTSKANRCFAFTERHVAFLLDIYQKTQKPEEAFYVWTKDILSKLEKSAECRQLVMVGEKDRNHLNFPVLPMSRIHGDFTPWNTAIERGKLCVFDWEYSQCPKPAFLDAFHFILQPLFLKKNCCRDEILQRLHGSVPLKNYLHLLGVGTIPLEKLLVIYLLEQYTFYDLRAPEKTEQEKMMLDRWASVIMELEKSW